ncbi:Fungal-trans multi-domain protein [Pyrenophora teres f. maculata]|nr:Fungal-trans multi-domain protein [Pyrenophora teres f. maculata]
MPAATRAPRVRADVVSKAVKIKCSGERPRCVYCAKHGTDCHYDEERKDRLRGAIRRNQVLTQLLIDISGQLDEQGRKRVQDTLASFDEGIPPPLTLSRPNTSYSKRPRQTFSQDNEDAASLTSADGGEALVSASVGSNEDLDFIQEDLLQNEDADNSAGYCGRNSHPQWLRALEAKVEQPEGEPSNMPYGPPGESGQAFNQRAEALRERQQTNESRGTPQNSFSGYYFYLDHINIEIDIDDPHILPSAQTAERLFDYYSQAVHRPFKILDDLFENQMRAFCSRDRGYSVNVCPRWKATMNLVFAIGARYSHLIGADWRADDHDHLVYMSRAVHLLQLDSMSILMSRPDQALIRATGLLSFYYLTIGHVSKAWYMIGIAIRHAQAAGLHLRYEDATVDPKRRMALAQIWWALYSIECVLTTITGRPRTISAKDCTVPPPGTIGTDMQASYGNTPPNLSIASPSISRASGSSTGEAHTYTAVDAFDVAYAGLDILMSKILSGLYSAKKSAKSWKSAQAEIGSLSEELEAWALKSLSHGPSAAPSEHNLSREQLLLYLYYQNAKVCITRPCLCRLDLRIKGQSGESAHFNQKMAEGCIGAALAITSMLPDPPNPAWFYQNGPWWAAVHMIMQGLTVLLLELSLDGIHLTGDKSHVTSCVDKLIGWLQSMGTVDAVSKSAYGVVAKVLSRQKEKDAAEKQMPQPQPMTEDRQGYSPQGFTLEPQPQPQSQPEFVQSLAPDPMDTFWPGSNAFAGGAFFPQDNTGNFYPNDVPGTEFLNDPGAGLIEYGQPQMNLFYGNPYQMTFDNWEWDPAAFEGHDQDQGQGQIQGQGYTQGQSQSQQQNQGQGFQGQGFGQGFEGHQKNQGQGFGGGPL